MASVDESGDGDQWCLKMSLGMGPVASVDESGDGEQWPLKMSPGMGMVLC